MSDFLLDECPEKRTGHGQGKQADKEFFTKLKNKNCVWQYHRRNHDQGIVFLPTFAVAPGPGLDGAG